MKEKKTIGATPKKKANPYIKMKAAFAAYCRTGSPASYQKAETAEKKYRESAAGKKTKTEIDSIVSKVKKCPRR